MENKLKRPPIPTPPGPQGPPQDPPANPPTPPAPAPEPQNPPQNPPEPPTPSYVPKEEFDALKAEFEAMKAKYKERFEGSDTAPTPAGENVALKKLKEIYNKHG